MNNYTIKQIHSDEYETIRKLDRDAFEFNERDSDGDFHEVFADNIRHSPYYILELNLIAVTDDGLTCLGHAIFSALPMGDGGEQIIWLNSAHGNNVIQSERLVLADWEDLRRAPAEATCLFMRGISTAMCC